MIPISSDVRPLIGEYAEFVDNRSLLYEKFSLPKVWGQAHKLDDAGRWSVLRIVSRGNELLAQDAKNLERGAGGKNVGPAKADRMRREAQVARRLATVAKGDAALVRAANDNARRFLAELSRSYPQRVATFEATLGGRLLVNMAGGVIENAGICLDRCFGLPLIPGSAVKGIARSQALWEIKEASPADRPNLLKLATAVFGFGKTDIAPAAGVANNREGAWAWAAGIQQARDAAAALGSDEFKGCACFLPAYPTAVPTLVVDMVNPHYPEYYRGKRERATDDENPIPNYFPAVEVGSAFGFAVLMNRVPRGYQLAELLAAARGWVERAITQKGAGAKTAAGYGWFRLGPGVDTPAEPKPRSARPDWTTTVSEATLKNHTSALVNPGAREGRLATIKADLARDPSLAGRLAATLAKQGKQGKKAIEWLKSKGVNLT